MSDATDLWSTELSLFSTFFGLFRGLNEVLHHGIRHLDDSPFALLFRFYQAAFWHRAQQSGRARNAMQTNTAPPGSLLTASHFPVACANDGGETRNCGGNHRSIFFPSAMNTTPVIRRYEPADVHSLIEIYQRAIHVLAAPFYSPAQLEAWAPAVVDPAKWHAPVSPQQTFIADCDGKPGAFTAWDWTGHIDFMFTHPAFARRGLARAFYVMAEKSMRQHAVSRLFAEVSLAARPFFASCGFVIESERDVNCRGQMIRQFIMSKTLI